MDDGGGNGGGSFKVKHWLGCTRSGDFLPTNHRLLLIPTCSFPGCLDVTGQLNQWSSA